MVDVVVVILGEVVNDVGNIEGEVVIDVGIIEGEVVLEREVVTEGEVLDDNEGPVEVEVVIQRSVYAFRSSTFNGAK